MKIDINKIIELISKLLPSFLLGRFLTKNKSKQNSNDLIKKANKAQRKANDKIEEHERVDFNTSNDRLPQSK